MNNKAAKKLRRLAIAIAAANGKIEDSERIYKNLKTSVNLSPVKIGLTKCI